MAIWTPIVTQLILDGLLNRPVKAVVAKRKAPWGFVALAALFLAIGIVYMVAALNTYFATLYGSLGALLLTGGSCLLLSALSFVTFNIIEDNRKIKARAEAALNSSKSQASETLQLIDDLTKGLEGPIANNPGVSAALATALGFLTGHRIH